MTTSAVNYTSAAAAQQSTANNATLEDLNLDEFLGLLIAQLQTQDPMNPMDNAEILQQVSQMRDIQSTTKLTDTLETVLLGQNMATASSLIGQTITGLSETAENVTGRVQSISVIDGTPKLHVGDQTITLSNVRTIGAEGD